MSAAVSAMQNQPGAGSNPGSRMGTHSPVDSKRSLNVKSEETRSTPQSFRDLSTKLNPPTQSLSNTSGVSSSIHPPLVDPPPSESNQNGQGNLSQNQTQHAQPSQAAGNGTPSDYFSLPRPNRLDQEPNPFEQSFASNSNPNASDPLSTPKAILPPVTAMTSPAPLLPGGSGSYNWGPNSLRSGPLSPAMLQGPTNSSSTLGFDSHLRTGLTPNESGIRSGLTPGGSGSMFPAPSPSGLFQSFGGSATPSTMEFQKTALSAARKSHPPPPLLPQNQDVKNEDNHINGVNHSHVNGTNEQSKQRQPSDPFNTDSAHNAANGLYLLAQMGNGAPGYQQAPSHMSSGLPVSAAGSIESSPNLAKRAAVNNATSAVGVNNRSVSGSSVSNTVRGMSEISNDMSDSSQERDMVSMMSGSRNTKGKNAKGKGAAANTGKRKNDDVNGSGKSSNKKSKGTPKMGQGSDDGFDMDDDDGDDKKDTKKMTDEEKRKNFLERNRVAALKCRQRKKQWLANLQAKVELYGTENDALNATVQALREEIVSLKTLLLAHKDCPVARSNGVQLDIASMAAGGDYGQVQMMAPYPGMGMSAGVMHHQAGGDRRYS